MVCRVFDCLKATKRKIQQVWVAVSDDVDSQLFLMGNGTCRGTADCLRALQNGLWKYHCGVCEFAWETLVGKNVASLIDKGCGFLLFLRGQWASNSHDLDKTMVPWWPHNQWTMNNGSPRIKCILLNVYARHYRFIYRYSLRFTVAEYANNHLCRLRHWRM